MSIKELIQSFEGKSKEEIIKLILEMKKEIEDVS